VEIVVAPNMNIIRGGSITNLGRGSDRMSIGRNLNRSLGLLIVTTVVVGTPKMVFINLIMTTHVNKIAN